MLGSLLRSRILLALLAFPAAATSQIVVDATGATGSFTDIQSAIDAASAGETILVQPGSYQPFVIDGKSLTILGVRNTTPVAATAPTQVSSDPSTVIRNLAAGQRVVLDGLAWVSPPSPSPIELENCVGLVVFTHCLAAGCNTCPVTLTDAEDVRFVDCRFLFPVEATRSRLSFVRSQFHPVFALGQIQLPPPAVQLFDGSTLDVAASEVIGARLFLPGQPAVYPSAVELDATSRLTAFGPNMIERPSGSLPPVLGSGEVRRDPFWIANPLTSGANEIALDRPGLSVLGDSQTAMVELFAQPGQLFGLVVGEPSPRSDPFSLGVDLGFTNGVSVLAGMAPVPDANGDYPVLNLALPPGLPPQLTLAWQAVVAVGPTSVTLTNDCVQVIGR